MEFKILLGFLSIFLFITLTHASIEGYITSSDRQKFIDIASKALIVQENDILSPYYGAKSYKILAQPVPKDVKGINCDHLKNSYKPSGSNIETNFNVLHAWSLLECDGKIHSDSTIKELLAAIENDKFSILEIRYALEVLTLLRQTISNHAKVAQILQTKLKGDDSLLSLGHALHASSLLGNSVKLGLDPEEIIVQADEVDGKLLQWEGGLTTTSLLITGLFRSPTINPLTQVQADKLANYLLTRKTVQLPKGVLALLEAASSLATSNMSPVSITIIGSSQISIEKPELKIQVSDIFGTPLKPAPTPVVAQSATRITDDVVVLAKQPLTPGASTTEYVLALRLEPGYYRLALNAGSHAATLNVRILGPITISSFEIGLSDADGSSAPKLTKLAYPTKLDKKLNGDANQHLVLKFALSRSVHQTFVRLSSGKKEIIFIAETDSSKVYKVTVNLAQELSFSDNFEIELIVGDSIISNPIRWNLGTIEVNLGTLPSIPKVHSRGPKPEIQHMFRPKDRRPPKTVSLLFTALTASPFLVLLVLWAKIGINFGNFTTVAVPFHIGLGSILGLFTLFWFQLDMFTTCAWLIPIGGFTFFSGHKLLSHLATNRKPEKAEK